MTWQDDMDDMAVAGVSLVLPASAGDRQQSVAALLVQILAP